MTRFSLIALALIIAVTGALLGASLQSHKPGEVPPIDITAAIEPAAGGAAQVIEIAPVIISPKEEETQGKADEALPSLPVRAVSRKKYDEIVVIIDDIGMDRKRSEQVLALPGPLTLAFLPYAANIRGMAASARGNGKEVIIHMPMEPMDGSLDTGPIALKVSQTAGEFGAMLEKGFNAFDGYVGMNNHMGSRLTADRKSMQALMAELKKRNLLFVDSWTSQDTVAAQEAEKAGVPFAVRDIFLDNENTAENLNAQLAAVERVARRYGRAVAIGHPKDATIRALAAWLPTLEEKGFKLIPVSAAVKKTAPPPVAGTQMVQK